MSQRWLFQVIFLAGCLAQTSAAHTQTKGPAKQGPQITAPRAKWSAGVEKIVGMTRDQFSKMALGKLTKDEFAALLVWIEGSRSQAEVKAKASQLTHSCGRTGTDAAAFQKVKLDVEISDKTPSELASGIRQRLRGISDVELVYSESEADIVVSILGFEDKTDSGRPLGYTVSVVTSEPCEWRVATYSGRMRTVQNHFLETSPNSEKTIEYTVTTLDAKDIEEMRKRNATWRQLYEKKP